MIALARDDDESNRREQREISPALGRGGLARQFRGGVRNRTKNTPPMEIGGIDAQHAPHTGDPDANTPPAKHGREELRRQERRLGRSEAIHRIMDRLSRHFDPCILPTGRRTSRVSVRSYARCALSSRNIPSVCKHTSLGTSSRRTGRGGCFHPPRRESRAWLRSVEKRNMPHCRRLVFGVHHDTVPSIQQDRLMVRVRDAALHIDDRVPLHDAEAGLVCLRAFDCRTVGCTVRRSGRPDNAG